MKRLWLLVLAALLALGACGGDDEDNGSDNPVIEPGTTTTVVP